jgi:PadR family transcriptional regulator, regulatory protein AphA
MSLRYAALALLTAQPMTGYELVQYFDATVGLMWAASPSQLYPELRRMETEGLVEAETVPRGTRAQKRRYRVTEQGRKELVEWAGTTLPFSPERDSHRLQIAYAEFTDLNSVTRLLKEHREYYTWRLAQWNNLLRVIQEARFPLMQARLDGTDTGEQKKIIAFKALALEGQVARAEAEIAWARRGLDLVATMLAEQPDGS